METAKKVEAAAEPVGFDDGIIDTGVLHELPDADEEETEDDEKQAGR